MTARFGSGRCEDRAVARLAARGFRPGRLSAYDPEGRAKGLVIGFADATPARIADFVAALRSSF